MNYKMMGKFIGLLLMVESIFMLPALLISLCRQERSSAMAFTAAIVILWGLGMLLRFFCRGAKKSFFAKEGLVCVGLGWLIMSLLGCLPFFLSGAIPNYVDALFEMVSGFTTTGASILEQIEGLPYGILYWRSFSHWLGGMGVLVFLLAIPMGGEGGSGFTMHLLRAESPGPNVGKLVPKMKQTAQILYILYIVLTVLNVIFLLIGGMPVFDAVYGHGNGGNGGIWHQGRQHCRIQSLSPKCMYCVHVAVRREFQLLLSANSAAGEKRV